MSHSIIKIIAAGGFVLSSAVAFAAPSTEVRIETGAQLANACRAFLAKAAHETENVVAAADPCRAYLAGFITAYGRGQSQSLETRVSGSAPTPPPPATVEINVVPKPEAHAPSGASGVGAPAAEKLPCFDLPEYLSFHDFAKLVVDFMSAHADYNAKPAYLASAAALAEKYPCR